MAANFLAVQAASGSSSVYPAFSPRSPESEFTQYSAENWKSYVKPGDPIPEELPRIDFCAEWNPEFAFNGGNCCRKIDTARRKKGRVSCFVRRPRGGFCEEMTPEQRAYTDAVESGRISDVLAHLEGEIEQKREQSFCTVNNGFLAHGRPLVPTSRNRIQLNNSDRCTNFGTDRMVALVEWLGHQVDEAYPADEYAGTHLLVGDIAAPRGGCLVGVSGKRGHLSHTNGRDADIGLLYARKGGRSPSHFHTDFDVKTNWWMAKRILNNPYACVKVIFIDKRHIKAMSKKLSRDPDWIAYRRFFRHMPGHKNHFHVRIGDHAGKPGCVEDAHPELEGEDEDFDSSDDSVDESIEALLNRPQSVSENQ